MRATCYYVGGTTASGLPADESVIAVDPSVISLGTRVYVTGAYGDFGERIAADTGGNIIGNTIDAVSYTHLDVYKRQQSTCVSTRTTRTLPTSDGAT